MLAPVNGSAPPVGPPGADEDAPPTAAVLVVPSPVVVVAPEVVVTPEVELPPELEVAPEVLVACDVVVPPAVVVVGAGTQPVTQKTLCLTSAPWEPSAW